MLLLSILMISHDPRTIPIGPLRSLRMTMELLLSILMILHDPHWSSPLSPDDHGARVRRARGEGFSTGDDRVIRVRTVHK